MFRRHGPRDETRASERYRERLRTGGVYPGGMTARPVENAERVVTAADVERAGQLIAGDVRETPVLPAGELSRRVGAPVVLKAECLQLTGSFKVRGVFTR